MEVTIADCRRTSFGFAKSKKDQAEFKRDDEFSNNFTKEAMFIFEAESDRIRRKTKRGRKKEHTFQGCDREVSHAKRALRKKCPFLKSNLSGCFMIFLKKGSFNL